MRLQVAGGQFAAGLYRIQVQGVEAQRASLLLYDPTRGVDVGTKSEIFQLMRDLAAKGYAILFYSSDLPELVNVADRVIVLRSGRVAATLGEGQLSEEAILRAAVLDEVA